MDAHAEKTSNAIVMSVEALMFAFNLRMILFRFAFSSAVADTLSFNSSFASLNLWTGAEISASWRHSPEVPTFESTASYQRDPPRDTFEQDIIHQVRP